jgi:hypothetical protein
MLLAVVTWVRDRGKLCMGSVVVRAALGQVFSKFVGSSINYSFHQLLHNNLGLLQ